MFIEKILYYIYEGVEEVSQFSQSYDMVVDEVESFTVSQIIFFSIFCREKIVADDTHIREMEMMKFSNKRIVVAFDVDEFHSLIYLLDNVIHNVCLFL